MLYILKLGHRIYIGLLKINYMLEIDIIRGGGACQCCRGRWQTLEVDDRQNGSHLAAAWEIHYKLFFKSVGRGRSATLASL